MVDPWNSFFPIFAADVRHRDDRARALRAGFQFHIAKPVDPIRYRRPLGPEAVGEPRPGES